MKKLITILCTCFAVAIISGCSDFLKVEKYGTSVEWKTEEDVDRAVAALLSYVSNGSEGITGRGIMWFECCSDNLTVGRPQSAAEQIRRFNMSPDNGRDAKDNWKTMYEVNAKANNIIKIVPMMSLEQAFKERAVANAYFFRGLSMLWISPYYGDNGPNGGIPIILENTEPNAMDSERPASVLQNYEQIIKDFNTAAEKLPLFSQLKEEEYGMPHKAAAWAFAARAALYAAHFDAKYYDTVIEMCDKIMGLTGKDKRELFDDGTPDAFAHLWTRENNFSSEYLFSLLGSPVDGPKFHGMSFQNGGWGIYNTWGYFQPTYGLWKAYKEGDRRRDATILSPGQEITFVGQKIVFGDKDHNISSDTGLTFCKFLSPWRDADCIGKEVSTNGDNASNTLGTCLIRFADIVLMKAEALIWKNGEGDGEAVKLLNSIRKRAGLPQDSNATKAELKNERRCELAFEYMPSRHLDLVRWGDAQEAYAQPTQKLPSHWDEASGKVVIDAPVNYDEGRNFNPEIHNVFPIPSYAFDGSVNLKQNIGY